MSAGVGRYLDVGSACQAIKHALFGAVSEALAAAGHTEVDVLFGFAWPAQWYDMVAVTAVRAAPDEGTLGPQRARQMTIFQDLSVVSFRTTDDERVPHDIAYGLLGVIDAHLREDPTMGEAALWCFSQDLTSDGATSDDEAGEGRLCEIAVTYAARVIVSR